MSKLKKRLWLGASAVAALMIVVGTVYAWTHSGYVTIERGITIGKEMDPGDRTIQFKDCGWGQLGYIDFSEDYANYIVATWFGTECLHLHAGNLMMKSDDSGAAVVVDQTGDVVITLGS
jgi:hypothetical protein